MKSAIDIIRRHNKDEARRRARLDARVENAIAALRRGAALHLSFTRKGPIWQLSTGEVLSNRIAQLVTDHRDVVGVDAGLPIIGGPAQTWRIAETEEIRNV
jgi:hypothetical protein